MPASRSSAKHSRSPWNSGPRGTYRRHRSLDDKTRVAEDRGMLVGGSNLCTKNVSGHTTTDACNRKPVNSPIGLHVTECRECGHSAKTCQSLERLRGGKEIVSLPVSRTQPSTSKRILHPKVVCASNRGGYRGPQGPSNRKWFDARDSIARCNLGPSRKKRTSTKIPSSM